MQLVLGTDPDRTLPLVPLHVARAPIYDRSGEVVAVSLPSTSVIASPSHVLKNSSTVIPPLAAALHVDEGKLEARVRLQPRAEPMILMTAIGTREFDELKQLQLPGVRFEREYIRYYPMGEVLAPVLDLVERVETLEVPGQYAASRIESGLAGLERLFDSELAEFPGSKRIALDELGREVDTARSENMPYRGTPLTISIDHRIQYAAYRALKRALNGPRERGPRDHRAAPTAGAVVVVDIPTGEVLASASAPTINPNDRSDLSSGRRRNRGATDTYTPGSTLDPFVVAALLKSGKVSADTPVDTAPGFVTIGPVTFRDQENLGVISLGGVVARSSRVGLSRLALQLPNQELQETLDAFGFGQLTGSEFPGEIPGSRAEHAVWRDVDRAALACGYGLSVTAFQLVQAYATLGAGGVRRPMSFRMQGNLVAGTRIVDEAVATQTLQILASASEARSHGIAAPPRFRVAGVSGKAILNAQSTPQRCLLTYGGVMPASAPQIAAVVLIDTSIQSICGDGNAATSAFMDVMQESARMLALPPDDTSALPAGQAK